MYVCFFEKCMFTVLCVLLILLPTSPARGAPDLAVSKSVDIVQPAPGQPVEFTIGLTNVGPDAALSAQVLDLLPAGLEIPAGMSAFHSVGVYDPVVGIWTVGQLEPAAEATLVIPAVITDAQPPACLVNVATASDPQDENPGNDTSVAALRQPGIDRCVDVSVSFISAVLVQSGCQEMHYQVTARLFNAGPDAATNVVVELSGDPVVGSPLGFVDAQCDSIVDGRCLLPELAAGVELFLIVEPRSLNINQVVSQDFTLSVTSSGTDYEPSNDSAARSLNTGTFNACPVIDVPEINLGGAPGCFIATAAYGSYLDPHVEALRRFRDRYLITSSPGRWFVNLYYRYSPPMADYIASRPWARSVTRALLAPIVMALSYPVTFLVLALLAILGLSLRAVRRWKKNSGRTAFSR